MGEIKKSLALFDFDGTITTKDTLIEFIKFYHGNFKFFLGLFILSPILLLFKLKILPNWKAKQTVLHFYFSGIPITKLTDSCTAFSSNILPKIVRSKAIKKINEHQKKHHRVIVVSASPDLWLKYWCQEQKVELISTELECIDGVITGNILGKNCYGEEKVSRIKKIINLKQYQNIYAYGDSNGDRPMLKLASYPHYKPFRN